MYYDLLSEKALSFPPYGNFRCNSDRTVVVGESDVVNNSNSGLIATLGIGSPKSRQIAQEVGFDFDVSPRGRYIAYMNVELNLCVARLAGSPTCHSLEGKLDGISTADSFFVSDDGGVLFDEKCQSDEKQSADCSSVGYWHPGQKTDKIIERHAQKAQFISAETAASLHRWVARLYK